MTDIETVRKLFPDAELVTLPEDPAYAISVAHRQVILAHGVDEDDAWKQAAVTLRREDRRVEKSMKASGPRVPDQTASQLLEART